MSSGIPQQSNVNAVPGEHLATWWSVLNAHQVQKDKPPYLIDLGVVIVISVRKFAICFVQFYINDPKRTNDKETLFSPVIRDNFYILNNSE